MDRLGWTITLLTTFEAHMVLSEVSGSNRGIEVWQMTHATRPPTCTTSSLVLFALRLSALTLCSHVSFSRTLQRHSRALNRALTHMSYLPLSVGVPDGSICGCTAIKMSA